MQGFNFKVTDEPIYNVPTSAECNTVIEKCHGLIRDKSLYAEVTIKRAIRKYPDHPEFRNYLASHYFIKGRTKKARLVNDELASKFPDYLFAKTLKAEILLSEEKGDLDRVAELLGGEEFSLNKLYPDKHLFHVSEVLTYYGLVIRYYLKKDNIDKAKSFLRLFLEEPVIGEENERVREFGQLILINIAEKNIEIGQEGKGLFPSVRSFPTVEYEQTDVPPVLNHEELRVFYHNEIGRLEEDTLLKLAALPRESLTQDLISILEDSIKRFDYFCSNEEIDFEETVFPFHALNFISILEIKEAIPVILDFLRQGDDFWDFWLVEQFLDLGVIWFYPIFKDELKLLSDFIREPNLSFWVRFSVIDTVAQVALYNENRKEEVIEWILNEIAFFRGKTGDLTIFSPIVMSGLIKGLLTLRVKEQLPLIEDIYEDKIVDIEYLGDFKYIKQDIVCPLDPWDILPMPLNILEAYSYEYEDRRLPSNLPAMGSSGFREDLVEQFLLELSLDLIRSSFSPNDDEEEEEDIYFEPPETIKRTTPKVGRNAPCPCGSGKKYKKCCLNK